jgi:putative hydrolase of HD superfamily
MGAEVGMSGLARFLFEMEHLKRVPRSGWTLVGIDPPESVAEHSFCTAVAGFVLAAQEGADPLKTAAICLFHDFHESRVSDMHHLGQAFMDWATAKRRATGGYLQRLPPVVVEHVRRLVEEEQGGTTREAIIAHDADRLELLLQAIVYQAGGADLADWIERQVPAFETASARRLAEECRDPAVRRWWTDLMAR